MLPEATNGAAIPHAVLQDQTDRSAPVAIRDVPPVRSCSECGGPVPAQSRAERATCSPRCAQLRHNWLRNSRKPTTEVLQEMSVAVTNGYVEVAAGAGLEVLPGDDERQDVLEAVVQLSELLPTGWHAELGPGSVTLSWHTV